MNPLYDQQLEVSQWNSCSECEKQLHARVGDCWIGTASRGGGGLNFQLAMWLFLSPPQLSLLPQKHHFIFPAFWLIEREIEIVVKWVIFFCDHVSDFFFSHEFIMTSLSLLTFSKTQQCNNKFKTRLFANIVTFFFFFFLSESLKVRYS